MNPAPEAQAYQSRAEREIADLLQRYQVPFLYEKPTAVVDAGKTKLWYPDFTLEYGLLIEYFGVHGDPSYAERMAHKLRVYEQNQYDVVAMGPADLAQPDWRDHLLHRISSVLDRRLRDYRARTGGVSGVARPYRGSRGY